MLKLNKHKIKSMKNQANNNFKEDLNKNEGKYRSVFELSPLGKSITGINGSFEINKAFSEMLGYSIKELKNKKLIYNIL